MEASEESWYIIKQASEACEILSAQAVTDLEDDTLQKWGPFETQNQAIAKRIGLIRAGKCQPI
ncbi:MAG: hypothetical protein WA885_03320 [Phormidesmis sp.]